MDRVDLGIVGGDGLRDAGVRDFIYANKERGTTAGRSFDDPASHREPSGRRGGYMRPAPCGALSRDMGVSPSQPSAGRPLSGRDLDAALKSNVRRVADRSPDEVILIETEDGVERMTLRVIFYDFERDLDDFEALKVCLG